MIDEQERTRMDTEELERERAVLLPDRIEMRRHKSWRSNRGWRHPVYSTVWCPPLAEGGQGYWLMRATYPNGAMTAC